MDEVPGADVGPIGEKLVALAVAGAVRPDRALAKHGGGIWDVAEFWDGLHSVGIRGGAGDPVLLPARAAQRVGIAPGNDDAIGWGSGEPDRPADTRDSD